MPATASAVHRRVYLPIDVDTVGGATLQEIYDRFELYRENITDQIDGQQDTFQTTHPFTSVRLILNGLEQSEGADADYIIVDNTHIKFYRALKPNETLRVEYPIA